MAAASANPNPACNWSRYVETGLGRPRPPAARSVTPRNLREPGGAAQRMAHAVRLA
jgi:hypothetical protein